MDMRCLLRTGKRKKGRTPRCHEPMKRFNHGSESLVKCPKDTKSLVVSVTQHRFSPGSRRMSSRSGAIAWASAAMSVWLSWQTSSVWLRAKAWNGQLAKMNVLPFLEVRIRGR